MILTFIYCVAAGAAATGHIETKEILTFSLTLKENFTFPNTTKD